jgi:hypothetical protein
MHANPHLQEDKQCPNRLIEDVKASAKADKIFCFPLNGKVLLEFCCTGY